MRVDGYIEAIIKVNGVTVPYATSNTVLAVQNVNVSLPTVRINMIDPTNIFDRDLPINDGTILEISVGDGARDPRNGKYRVFGTPPRKPASSGVTSYIVHGILDAIPYIRSNPQRGINGNASSAMQQIASTVGFTLNNNATTNDSMMWLPGRKTWNGFAEMLARHGWVNDTSALHIGVDMAKTLHFHDINQLFSKGQILRHFFHGQPPQNPTAPLMLVESYKAENHSGMLNNTFGYGLRMPQPNIVSGAVNKFMNVKAMTVNNLIDMNKDILGSIGSRGRLDIPRIFTANTHDNYVTAQHQNQRIKATYSQVVSILVPAMTGLTLFDMVQFSAITNGSTDDSVTGLYCVTAISTALKGRRYKEKLQLTSAGPQNGSANLV